VKGQGVGALLRQLCGVVCALRGVVDEQLGLCRGEAVTAYVSGAYRGAASLGSLRQTVAVLINPVQLNIQVSY
jgi:hypothetical protein